MIRPSLVLLLCSVIAGCGGGSTATPTLRPLVTPGITPTAPRATATSAPSPTSSPSWPAGWDDAFCVAFDELVVAQQLARDIGRALADEAPEDAVGLTHELGRTVTGVRTLLTELPEWDGAEDAQAAINALLAEDEQLVTFYVRFLEEDRAPALERARESEAALRDQAVPAVETELAQLANEGLACPAGFDLETPDEEAA